MNLFEGANITRRKGIIISRLERIKREGSPNYPYVLPATAAGVTVTIYLPTLFPLSRKYQPLDFLECVNNEPANPIIITINGADAYLVSPGTIRTVHGQGVALWQVAIQNTGGLVTTLGNVAFTFKKEALTIDRWAQNK